MNLRGATNLEITSAKVENGDLLADYHNILNQWKNYFQLLNVHNVSDVRLKYIQLNH
jgi:hypothetical protein